MKYIVLDLEMNPIHKDYKEQKKICRSEIIQIGAIALDDDFQETDSFLTYVKPQYNDIITEVIQNLTGITTEMVQTAPDFHKAMRLPLTRMYVKAADMQRRLRLFMMISWLK